MIRIGSFLHKQGQYLLQNQLYALVMTAALAAIPFAAWLSLSVVALVTLRKGGYDGFKVLVAGLTVAIITASQSTVLPYTISSVVMTFSMGYIAALMLRFSASWKIVTGFMLTMALLGMLLIACLLPDYIMEQFQVLLTLFRSIEQGEIVVRLLDSHSGANQELLANYLLGVKAFSIVLSALSSLMLARYIQSLLFNPGGFRAEILEFRASRIGVLLLVISAIGAYQGNLVAVSCLPILVVYLMAAGMSLLFNIMSRKQNLVTIFLLFVPLVIAPYVMLPVYVFFGSLDSLFNFRLRLLSKTGELRK
ncbi:MAG: hypothetical protein Q8M03_15445 [Legionella sp.]|nr:hypothetical protein [Legionella sp.]